MKIKQKKLEGSPLNITVKVVVLIILSLYSLSMLLLFVWGIITSLKSNFEFLYMHNILGFPTLEHSKDELLFANYRRAFKYFEFTKQVSFYFGEKEINHFTENTLFTMILNTLLYAGVGAFLATIVPCVVSYLCAKFKYKFSGFLYGLVVTVMTIPIIGSTPAMITLMRSIGLYDTFIGYFFQNLSFGGMYFLVFYAFFETMPDTYSEAAEIDGANYYTILLRIILPLAGKMIATIFLIVFVNYWNDYQTALIHMPTHPTLAYGVYRIAHEVTSGDLANIPTRISVCMMLAVPILIVFVIFKDKIMGNISIGGIKG